MAPGLPLFFELDMGTRNFAPENVIAYEAGYRAAPTDYFSWDIATFINDYHKLEGVGPVGATGCRATGPDFSPGDATPTTCERSAMASKRPRPISSRTHGGCLAPTACSKYKPAAVTRRTAAILNGSSPHNQTYLRSSWDCEPGCSL